VVSGGRKYLPYGEERAPTANGQDKFATYYRDLNGLDYADQRYYWSAMGRFLTPDPLGPSAVPANPASWNRYSYTWSDPINFNDPDGMAPANVSFEGGWGCMPTGLMAPRGSVDASSSCPPGMTIQYNSGHGSTQTWQQQAADLFSDLDPNLIADWDYTGTPFKYQLNLTQDQFLLLAGEGFLSGGVIVLQQAPRYWERAIMITAAGIAVIKSWWLQRGKTKTKEELDEEQEARRICEELAHAKSDKEGWGRYGKEWVEYYKECFRTRVWSRE
jgi:RHS repeat-associated protein